MICTISRGKCIQIFVSAIGCLTEFLAGVYTAWTSPTITLLMSEETPLESGPMSKEQVSLMTSMLYIGAILGSFSAGWLVNGIGRKWSFIFSMASQLIANSLIILANTPILLFISRIFSGFITGATFVILPIFISEITQKKLDKQATKMYAYIFKLKNNEKFIQIFVVIIGCLAGLLGGVYLGWTSPMILLLLSEETPLRSGPMTKDQVSLLTSMLFIGAAFGSLTAGLIVNVIGRKWTLILSMMCQLVGNTLIILADNHLYLFIARIFSGLLTGVGFIIMPIFISEITQKNMRTTLGNFFGLSCNMGHLVGKALTNYGFYVVPSISLGCAVIFIGCFLMFPDTPEYLLLRNRGEDAAKSLKFYRGVQKDEPFPEMVASEFDEMKKVISLRNPNAKVTIRDFKAPTTILAIIITFVMTSNINFTGIRLTTSFTATMLKDAGIDVDISLTDNIICVLQVFGCIGTIYIIRWIKVRASFVIFYILSIICFFGAGIQYFLHENGVDMIPYTWSFVSCIVFAVVLPSIAINNLSMNTSSQILPTKIRGSVLGTLNILGLIVAFFTTQYYLYLVDTIGNSLVMCAMGCWCVIAVVFTYFFLPELHNQSYSDIVNSLRSRLPGKFKVTPHPSVTTM